MIWFHRVLIGTAIAFFLMLTVLEGILWYTGERGLGALLLAIGSGAATAVLGYYLANLDRFVGDPTRPRRPLHPES